jgi:outer membrane protein assembly factor BamD
VTARSGSGHRSIRTPALLALAMLLSLGAALSGCSTHGKARDYEHVTAAGLYHDARKSLDDNDFESAVKQYEALTSRFPFSDETRQARLDLICLYYRKGDKEAATDAAEQFLRENPTHPRVDYAWYMKGLIDYEDTPWKLERWLGVDAAKRPPAALNSAITSFSTVVKQYPKSEYAYDAQLRLIYLRNRLAEYEINVARYYLRRGAYVAAADRSLHMIEEYDGAPAVKDGLGIMIESYRKLGLTDLQSNVERVYQTNYQQSSDQNTKQKKWWHLW